MSVWKSDEKLLSICILNFSFENDFVWEEISNIRHSVSSPDETPRSSSKILRCASYFQLSSRCFIWWWNTASHVWYITSRVVKQNRAQSRLPYLFYEYKKSVKFPTHSFLIFKTYFFLKQKSVLSMFYTLIKQAFATNRSARYI